MDELDTPEQDRFDTLEQVVQKLDADARHVTLDHDMALWVYGQLWAAVGFTGDPEPLAAAQAVQRAVLVAMGGFELSGSPDFGLMLSADSVRVAAKWARARREAQHACDVSPLTSDRGRDNLRRLEEAVAQTAGPGDWAHCRAAVMQWAIEQLRAQPVPRPGTSAAVLGTHILAHLDRKRIGAEQEGDTAARKAYYLAACGISGIIERHKDAALAPTVDATEMAAGLIGVPLVELQGWLEQRRACSTPPQAAEPAPDPKLEMQPARDLGGVTTNPGRQLGQSSQDSLRIELADCAGRILIEATRLRYLAAKRRGPLARGQ